MVKHLFKLIWNRKRTNFLMILEIVISFFVLFFALTIVIYNVSNYTKPLGFSYDDVWRLTIDLMGAEKEEVTETIRQFENILRSYPEVEQISLANALLFFPDAMSITSLERDGREIKTESLRAGDDFHEVLDVEILQGRWFDASDNSAKVEPIVINQNFSDEMFQGENPVGQIVNTEEREYRIIGVIGEFRRAGELSGSKKVAFHRISVESEAGLNRLVNEPFNRILIEVKPGTGMDFEARMLRDLSAAGKNFTLTANHLEESRDSAFKKSIVIPIVLFTLAGFFIANVALGLFGIIWNSINRRRSEIGLRRALGAPAGMIYKQILGEVLVLTTFGIGIGACFALQFPMLNVLGFIGNEHYLLAFALSVLFIYLIAAICALYPSSLASRIQPAVALHEE